MFPEILEKELKERLSKVKTEEERAIGCHIPLSELEPRRDVILRKLKELAKDKDTEKAHLEADTLLLLYINDYAITKAYDEIKGWYA